MDSWARASTVPGLSVEDGHHVAEVLPVRVTGCGRGPRRADPAEPFACPGGREVLGTDGRPVGGVGSGAVNASTEPGTARPGGPVSAPRPALIGLDGRSGVGKTTLAAALAARLAPHARVGVLHVEEMYPGWDGLAAATADDGPYVRAVAALTAGRPAGWRAWDWHAGAPGEARALDPDALDVVVCEGVGALCPGARPLLDLAVWVDAPEDVRRTAALARDGDAYAPHWERWARQEEAYLAAADPAGAADLRLSA